MESRETQRALEKYSNTKCAAVPLSSPLRATYKGFLVLAPSTSHDYEKI
jgi:hypothetical protein